MTAKEVKQLLDGIPKDMPILIDEAYHHFVDDPAYGMSLPYVLEGRTVQPVIEEFRSKGVLVGRPFPPMIQHLRVSVGLPEEMDRFLKGFKEIFPKKAPQTMVRG